MKMILNIEDRLAIAQFLPTEGSLSEQLIGKSILDKTFITKEDRKELRYDPLYGNSRIDPETDFDTEVTFSDEEFELLYSNFIQKDRDKKINSVTASIALKIRDAKAGSSKDAKSIKEKLNKI